jgi:hypothetical protein
MVEYSMEKSWSVGFNFIKSVGPIWYHGIFHCVKAWAFGYSFAVRLKAKQLFFR